MYQSGGLAAAGVEPQVLTVLSESVVEAGTGSNAPPMLLSFELLALQPLQR